MAVEIPGMFVCDECQKQVDLVVLVKTSKNGTRYICKSCLAIEVTA